eukprot:TRINITY_DN70207_c0_g1_i1.p1 TRINITY_DN70207_c0_g1~~TRINITY_DN70207_c0_g1_i1.p1  ORF type:complete len:332 (+),score=104.98 TRINITY_DN70207_c0_g1_i1:95-997(+)
MPYRSMGGGGGLCPPSPGVARTTLCIAIFFYFFMNLCLFYADTKNCDSCDLIAAGGGMTGLGALLLCFIIFAKASNPNIKYVIWVLMLAYAVGILLIIIGRSMYTDDNWDSRFCFPGSFNKDDSDDKTACRAYYIGYIVGEALVLIAAFLFLCAEADGPGGMTPPSPQVSRAILLVSIFFYCLLAVGIPYALRDCGKNGCDGYVTLIAIGGICTACLALILLLVVSFAAGNKLLVRILCGVFALAIFLEFIGRCIETDKVWDFYGRIDGGDRMRCGRLGLIIGEFLWFIVALLYCLADAM